MSLYRLCRNKGHLPNRWYRLITIVDVEYVLTLHGLNQPPQGMRDPTSAELLELVYKSSIGLYSMKEMMAIERYMFTSRTAAAGGRGECPDEDGMHPQYTSRHGGTRFSSSIVVLRRG